MGEPYGSDSVPNESRSSGHITDRLHSIELWVEGHKILFDERHKAAKKEADGMHERMDSLGEKFDEFAEKMASDMADQQSKTRVAIWFGMLIAVPFAMGVVNFILNRIMGTP
jgi:hypothetical protein